MKKLNSERKFSHLKFNFYKLIGAIFYIISTFSCTKAPFPGYKSIGNYTFYKLISFDAEKRETSENNYVEIDFSKTYYYKDSIPVAKNIWINLSDYPKNSEVTKMISKAAIGDSISLIVPNQFFIFSPSKDTSLVVVNLKIRNKLNAADHSIYLKNWLNETEMKEQTTIKNYINANHFQDIFLYTEGIYQNILLKGNENIAVNGSEVTIEYLGKLLNGKIIDSSFLNGAPLKFIYGNSGQVIKGIEIALKNLGEGGKVEIIIPSQLAFGEKGSINGVVEPYTSVFYTVKLIAIAPVEL